MSDNIKVVVKVRPLISREIEEKLSHQWKVRNNTLFQLDQNGKELGQSFTFDKVYDQNTKTSDVYHDVAKPIVEAATAGFNGTIFAYGQTSSGKTYTMTGTENSPGIIPLAVLNLFEIIKNAPNRDFLVRVSYMEIYNETVRDLLSIDKESIKIHDTLQGIKVDVTEKVTSSPEEVLEVMKMGEANREKGATNMNDESSRSHSIFQITIESRDHVEGEEEAGCVNVSQLNLVDLAGSERAGQTGATGKRFKEGTHINKSLSSLALVIKQLSEDPNRFVNYRDSKLTRILQNSLGGNAKTSIVCAVTPAAIEETISTLQFANRAKAIRNKPEVNAVVTIDHTMIQQLTKKMCTLQAKLESKKNLEKDNHKLQKQIASLQKLILNGFARRDVQAPGARRKPPLRRVTISTLHAAEPEHAAAPAAPRFCTPGLKYNPNTILNPSEFVPIQNARSLASVPEEPAVRLITPPLNDRRVCFNKEVIDIDSDDDSVQGDAKTCPSPYHSCHADSKTPPCVLRKNVKLAEKNLKDLMEMTEREKIYTPNIVEYIEKLEQNSAVICRLQDELDTLKKQGQQKDLEVEHLKKKIDKTEEELKALTSNKLELQTQCESYNIKLNDFEVCYETLKNKAKLREEELLSLLEEMRVKKTEVIGKQHLPGTLDKDIPFMDMSKDISLVNSENDYTGGSSNGDESGEQLRDLVTDMQIHSHQNNQKIVELEANIFTNEQKIASLEDHNQDLQNMVTAFKDKLANIETENEVLKSTIENLNSTISNQKECLDSANNDIESYNRVIQELQIKLTQKENTPHINMDDSVLERMIVNEEQFISNNENIQNIIHLLKQVLDNRNKEITELKSSIHKNTEVGNITESVIKQPNFKNQDSLIVEVENLKKQVHENVELANKLSEEKQTWQAIEEDFIIKLADITEKYSQLEKVDKENNICLQNFEKHIEYLTRELTDKDNINIDLSKQNNILNNRATILEKEIDNKEKLISSLSKEAKETDEILHIAKMAYQKLQAILTILTGDIQEVPELVDNFVNIFKILSNNLDILEAAATDILTQKKEVYETNNKLSNELEKMSKAHALEILSLHNQIENLIKSNQHYGADNTSLSKQVEQLNVELIKCREELHINLCDNDCLKTDLIDIKRINEELRHDIVSKDNIICELNKKEKDINAILESKQECLDRILQIKDKTISEITIKLEDMENLLKIKTEDYEMMVKKLNDVQTGTDKLLTDILRKVSSIFCNNNIHNNLPSHLELSSVYERIVIILDKIADHITFINLKNVDCEQDTLKNVLTEARKEISDLTEHNRMLVDRISCLEGNNTEMIDEINSIKKSNNELNDHLVSSQEILQDLHQELGIKANEITNMESKVLEWKDQFTNLDILMKQQLHELHIENENLKTRCGKLQSDSEVVMLCEVKQEKNDLNRDNKSQSVLKPNKSREIISPPSLLTICCNKIVDAINESDSKTTSTNIDLSNDTGASDCRCNQLSQELNNYKKENLHMIMLLEELEIVNKNLITEQQDAREEIQLLLELCQELKKKIMSHKTNVSILTATTYAENKSLKSQVKVLQHHHSRYHNVCQRDIPEVKKQLRDLMLLLQSNASVLDSQDASFKRFSLPDVLDSSGAIPTFKNESTLDGDLLMLDTNITLTTTADNTLLGPDQICLDITQGFYKDSSCQTDEIVHVLNENIQAHMEILNHDNLCMFEKIKLMRDENVKLRDQVNQYLEIKQSMINPQNSPMKSISCLDENTDSALADKNEMMRCTECRKKDQIQEANDKLESELRSLSQELTTLKSQKADVEGKYNNLVLEIPSTETLIRKLNILQKEYDNKSQENNKLNNTLLAKSQQLKTLQEENDSLSTQVMENISELDDLNKQLVHLKNINTELSERNITLEKSSNKITETQHQITDTHSVKSVQNKTPKTKLNRSLSDSDTSSRYNKICTLQSELHAGREDCKELTEDVVTIKNHLDRSNMSMDLDDSMVDPNVFTIAQDFTTASPQSKKCNMPDIPEEVPIDIYMVDKVNCYNYYCEKIGIDSGNLNNNIKIVEIMKMFYENLIVKHSNEIENLTNRLRDYDDIKKKLVTQVNSITEDHTKITKILEEKDKAFSAVKNTLLQVKNNVNLLNEEIINIDATKITNVISKFKDNILKILDNEMGLSTVTAFEILIDKVVNKNQAELTCIIEQYTKLQNQMDNVTLELNSVNNNLTDMKCQLSNKENEFNLLKAQKERIQEISSAVTLDIVKREKELNDTMTKGFQRLCKFGILTANSIDLKLPLNTNINLLFDQLITLNETLNRQNAVLKEHEVELDHASKKGDELQDFNKHVTQDLIETKNKIHEFETLHGSLKEMYDVKFEENAANLKLIDRLTEEINVLKAAADNKDKTIDMLENELHKLKQSNERDEALLQLLENIKDENENLKALNEMVIKEKDSYAIELQKSGETLEQNTLELERMTSDILELRKSVKENLSIIEHLKDEARILLKENTELKEKWQEKCSECSRLETNIKTHEKTAEIQTRIISRLEKQKNEDDKIVSEKNKQVEELSQKCAELKMECGTLNTNLKGHTEEMESLRRTKQVLEARIADLETALDGYKQRLSIDAIADSSRRRRQSIHDSKRMFAEDKHEIADHNQMEVLFGSRTKPDDLFMDVDGDVSNRSTPIRMSKGRDSLSVSRTDQSDRDEEPPSRPSSVQATRRRRQSTHDLQRSVLRHTPSPHDNPLGKLLEQQSHSKSSETSVNDSEISQLKERLASCQQELEDLKEKYRELDEECETCAEYLQERDQQCIKLKKEKAALQNTIAELNEKVRCSLVSSQQVAVQQSVAHAAVNTDEDWANLHSVVVDRMSYDAEVEKNKKLTKTIEDLRFRKQDLKNTLAKMQRALEKNSGNRELEATKKELQQCKEDLEELRVRYKDLDEECEMCSQYLREREDQCRKLKEAKMALEAKIEELQADGSARPLAARRRRQSQHDRQRDAAPAVRDAFTETTDILTYQVERNESPRMSEDKQVKDMKRLQQTVERLSQQKAMLEQKLLSMSGLQSPHPMYVATGSAIVQNQQLTDVMKENQKLKKMNAKLITICKKRGKESNRENEDPGNQG